MAEINDIRFMNKTSLKQFYQNSKNNIEDPIFTGFTVEIDQLHSPLFFSVCKGVVDDTLRSSEGNSTANYRQELTSTDRTKLSEAFETALKFMYTNAVEATPSEYEIRTLYAKDPFGNNHTRKPGYGLWERIYQDNVLYGAVDYIYMVDKYTVSPDTKGVYKDDFGVTDIGDGTPNKSGTKYLYDLQHQKEFDFLDKEIDGKVTTTIQINIYFDNDKYDIRADQVSILNSLKEFANVNSSCKLDLKGYASNDGSATAEHNMELSKNRVNTVAGEITNSGVDNSRITTSHYGQTTEFSKEQAPNRVVVCSVSGEFTKESALQLKELQKEFECTDPKIADAHNNNVQAKNNASEELERIGLNLKAYGVGNNKPKENETPEEKKKREEIEAAQKSYKEKKDIVDNYPSKIEEDKRSVISKLNEIQQQVLAYQKLLDKQDYSSNTAILKIKELYDNDFTNLLNDVKEKEYINVEIPTFDLNSEDITNEIKKYVNKNNKNNENQTVENEDVLRKMFVIIKTKITKISVKDEVDNALREAKKFIADKDAEVFGIHPDGRLGTEFDPAPGSKFADYMNKKDLCDNDEYQQKKQEAEDIKNLKNNLKNTEDYKKYAESQEKYDTVRNFPEPTAETAKETQKELYEVPQTVYDMFGFIDGMDKMIHDYPYVMQSVTGLDEAYKKYFEIKDPYMGSGDGRITIDCLEYLDMRITSMFNKYFNAAYDRQYRRERVPVNLRRFNCSIFVHDIRNFKDTIFPKVNDYDRRYDDYRNITTMALNYLSAIEFKFFDCEIVPEETGNLFDNVSNVSAGDMRTTKFTFSYGNCVINFLPFEDLRKYVLEKDVNEIVPKPEYTNRNLSEKFETNNLDGNIRRWFDRSMLGNVNNNDYRDYIRHDSSVVVDDHFRTGIVNNFAEGSVAAKNNELTTLDDALRRMVIGISASTGIPTKDVPDALNVKFLKSVLEQKPAGETLQDIGNVNETVPEKTETLSELGNVNDTEKGGK